MREFFRGGRTGIMAKCPSFWAVSPPRWGPQVVDPILFLWTPHPPNSPQGGAAQGASRGAPPWLFPVPQPCRGEAGGPQCSFTALNPPAPVGNIWAIISLVVVAGTSGGPKRTLPRNIAPDGRLYGHFCPPPQECPRGAHTEERVLHRIFGPYA